MKFICFGLLSNLLMCAWSVYVIILPQKQDRWQYSGWLGCVGLAFGNVVFFLNLLITLICKSPQVGCLGIVGTATFIYSISWGVHFIQKTHKDQTHYSTLITAQLVHAFLFAFLLICAVCNALCCKKKRACCKQKTTDKIYDNDNDKV